jgi:hypothetical protein
MNKESFKTENSMDKVRGETLFMKYYLVRSFYLLNDIIDFLRREVRKLLGRKRYW